MSAAVRLALVLCAALAFGSHAAHAQHDEHDGHDHGAAAKPAAAPATAARAAAIPRTPRPAEAKLYIISPRNGETVSSPVTIRFGLTGMGVAPAGVATAKTGHHHLLIDVPLPADFGLPIPADANHVHFGGGQTETTVELPPGQHAVRLLLGDQNHVPHEPPLYSDEISFTVE